MWGTALDAACCRTRYGSRPDFRAHLLCSPAQVFVKAALMYMSIAACSRLSSLCASMSQVPGLPHLSHSEWC